MTDLDGVSLGEQAPVPQSSLFAGQGEQSPRVYCYLPVNTMLFLTDEHFGQAADAV